VAGRLTDSSSDAVSPASPRDPGDADHHGLEGEAEVVRERARPRRALLLVAGAVVAVVVAAALGSAGVWEATARERGPVLSIRSGWPESLRR